MDRRSFIHSAAGAGLLPQAAQSQESSRKTRLYRIDYFYYRQGGQAARLNQFFSSQAPLLAKHTHCLGVFNAVFAPRLPTLMVLSGFERMDGLMSAATQVEADDGYRKAFEEFESGSEPPFD